MPVWWWAISALAFDAQGPVPGEPDRTNVVEVSGADRGATLFLYRGLIGGSSEENGCALDLGEAELLAEAVVDDAGEAELMFDVDFTWANQPDSLQIVQRPGCCRSAVLEVTWTVRSWFGEWFAEAADVQLRGGQNRAVFGSRVVMDGDMNGDGTLDVLVSAPHEPSNGDLAGSIYVFSGPIAAGEALADQDEYAEITGEQALDWAGLGLSYVGDIDGDGDDDVAVGAPRSDRNGTWAGAAYLVHMPVNGTFPLTAAAATLYGNEADHQAGLELSPAHDGDGDGLPDVWVAAPGAGEERGVVYLVSGTTRGIHNLGDVAIHRVQGEAGGDFAGQRLASLDDINNDGRAELVLGAEGSDRSGTDAGAAYLVTPGTDTVTNLADADAIWTGERPGDFAGAGARGLGDLNGDGQIELGITARGESTGGFSGGALYLVGPPFVGEHSLSDAWGKLTAEGAGDFAGAHAVSCDLDGDDHLDLAVSAHHAGPGPATGRAYIFYGPLGGGEASLGTADLVFRGDEPESNVGQSFSCADLDGDGLADLAMGAEGDESEWGGVSAGSVFIAFGRDRMGPAPVAAAWPFLECRGCGCVNARAASGGATILGLLLIVPLLLRRSARV